MIVTDRPLPELPMDALVATDTDDVAGIAEGEIVGYRCEHCGAGDETLMQVIHDEDCPLAGEHGRSLYPDPECPWGDGSLPEFEADHRIDVLTAGWTDDSECVHNGEAILFRCGECGNADETLFQIRHDEDCSLAGRHGHSRAGRAVADGGE